MHKFLNIRSASAFLMIAVILCVCFSTPMVKASRNNALEVELLLVYDKSYEAFMNNEYNITNYGERVGQIALLGGVPFQYEHNIVFNVTTGQYETYFGTDPAMSCGSMYHPPLPGSGNLSRMVWSHYTMCQCTGLSHAQHHSNPSYYLTEANQYAGASTNIYDDVGIVKAHALCSAYAGNHYFIGGSAIGGGPGFVIDGKSGFVTGETNPEQFYNILYTKFYFSHEISHNYGAPDGYYASNPCTANEPCTMSLGFHFIVFAANVWCTRCNNAIELATFGQKE